MSLLLVRPLPPGLLFCVPCCPHGTGIRAHVLRVCVCLQLVAAACTLLPRPCVPRSSQRSTWSRRCWAMTAACCSLPHCTTARPCAISYAVCPCLLACSHVSQYGVLPFLWYILSPVLIIPQVLSGCALGRASIHACAGYLRGNRGLEQLDLSGNRVGDEGAQLIGAALATNVQLRTLALDDCDVGDAGVVAFSSVAQADKLPLVVRAILLSLSLSLCSCRASSFAASVRLMNLLDGAKQFVLLQLFFAFIPLSHFA